MNTHEWKSSTRRATPLLAAIALIAFGLLIETPIRARSQSTAAATNYKYDVASIKPSKSMNGRWGAPSDGLTVTGVTPLSLIQSAYKIYGDYGLLGAPGWLNSEHYDVEAKMDTDVADAIKKLSKDDRTAVRQQMLQALLAERFGLVIHHETREMSVYFLVIGKNGPKIQEAKPGDTYATGVKLPSGTMGAGMIMGVSGGGYYITAQAVPLATMIPSLAGFAGRPILDKTGLAGNYDFKLQWSKDDSQLTAAGPPTGQPPLPTDPNGPNLFTAIQEQLGLKLESGKGPVEVIVIDHIERPSGN